MHFKIVLVFFALISISMAAPTPDGDDANAETLHFQSENNGVDKYFYAYETSNGISRNEEGELKKIGEGAAIIVHGSTAWTAPDGKKYEIVFTADEAGYRPSFRLVA